MKSNEDNISTSRDCSTHGSVNAKPPLPVDHGWAWCIMFGAFINVFVFMIFNRANALFFIQFLEKYKESATVTTLAFGLFSATFAMFSLFIPTFLLPRFEVRSLAVTGACIHSMSIVIIAFAPNMVVIDVMMATMGLSQSIISVPQTTLIGHYFKRQLAFASAFVNLGFSIATIISAHLTQLLLEKYGLRGTILVLAALNMNAIPASMLFRPPSMYADVCLTVVQEKFADTAEKTETPEAPDDVGACDKIKIKKAAESGTFTPADKAFPLSRSLSDSAYKGILKRPTANAEYSVINMYSSPGTVCGKRVRSLTTISDFIDAVSVSSTLRYWRYPEYAVDASLPIESSEWTPSITSKTTKDIDEDTEVTEIRSAREFDDSTPVNKPMWTRFRGYLSQSIFTHPLGILLAFASGLGVHAQTSIAYMPSVGRENGLSDSQLPYLITALGIGDLISKLTIGMFADAGYVKRVRIPCVSELMGGIMMQFVSFFKGFKLMVPYLSTLGMTLGVLHTMLPVIVVDTLGVKYLGHIMAGYYLISGISLFCDHLIFGLLKDSTGTFKFGYNYIGCMLLLSSFLFLLLPAVAKFEPPPK